MIRNFTTALFLTLAAYSFSGCGSSDPKKEVDTSTTGTIKMSVDDTFLPLADAELQTFHSLYKFAQINVSYRPEAEIVRDLQRDSARTIMISRLLTKKETEVFDKLKIQIKPLKIAVDAVAIVMHPDNPTEQFTVTQLAGILSGKVSNWSQVEGNTTDAGITIVFDNQNSSTVRYLADSVLLNKPFAGNAFAANTNPEVVEYVSKNKNAIGVIGLSWISDHDDTLSSNFLQKIKVAALKEDRNGRTGEYCQPYQAYLTPNSTKLYPLRRNIYLISREARAGLATGFASFVASERGQRIVLKSGLLPATMPIRLVQFGDSDKIERRHGDQK